MRTLLAAVIAALAGASTAAAQRPDSTRADSARRARADSIRAGRERTTVDSLAAVIRGLESRMDSLARAGGGAPPPAQAPAVQPGRTAGAYMNIGFDGLGDFGWSSEPNVASLLGGDHDPLVRGFTRSEEQ